MAIKKNTAIGGTSLLLLVMALGRYCLKIAAEHKEKKDRQLMAMIGKNAQQAIHDSRRVIDSLLKARGKVFLYSNDTTAVAGWAPNTDSYEAAGVASIVLEASALKNFVKKQDSLGYSLVVRHSGIFLPVEKVRLFNGDSTSRRLWFVAYDSYNKLPKDSDMLRRFPEIYGGPFHTSWGLGFNKLPELQQQVKEDWILKGMLISMRLVDGFYLYMVAAEKEDGKPSVDEETFAAAVRMLNGRMQRMRIDTMRFQVKICTREGNFP